MSKGKSAAFEGFAKKIDANTKGLQLGKTTTVSIGWLERRKLNDYPSISETDVREGVELFLRHSIIEKLEVDYYEDGTLCTIEFAVRRSSDM